MYDKVDKYIVDNLNNESDVRQGSVLLDKNIVDNLNNEYGVQQGWRL